MLESFGKDVNVLTQEEAQKVAESGVLDQTLPPPGYQRDEVLAQRKDALQEAAEKMPGDRIDPNAVLPDHNIQSDIVGANMMHISVDECYIVKWVNCISNHGNAVWQAKYAGWQLVTKDMLRDPRDYHLVKEDGTVRVADVLAVYMRMDQHLIMEDKRKRRQAMLELGVTSEAELQDLAKRNSKAFQILNSDSGDERVDLIAQTAAQRTALRHIGEQMKRGPIPGVSIR